MTRVHGLVAGGAADRFARTSSERCSAEDSNVSRKVVWGNNHLERRAYDHFDRDQRAVDAKPRTAGAADGPLRFTRTTSQGWGTQRTGCPTLRGRLQGAKTARLDAYG